MRLNLLIILLFITGLTLPCCILNQDKKMDPFLNAVESEVFRNFMDKDVIDENEGICIVFPASIKYIGFTGFIVEFNKEKSEEILHSIKEEYARNIPLNDSCIYFVGRTNNRICSKTTYLIPDFKNTLLCGDKLSGDLDINIVNQKKGEYLDKTYIYDDNDMPATMKHGFSNGYITDRRSGKNYFWLIIW